MAEPLDTFPLKPEHKPIDGQLAWHHDNLSDPSTYSVDLEPEDLLHLDTALHSLLDLGLDPEDIDCTSFPVPASVAAKLQQCAQIIHNGHGFCVLRGATSNPLYSVENSVLAFLGIASHVGDRRGLQNKQGHMLSHITESKGWKVPREKRHGIHSNASLPFHTDMGTDILALQVRGCAAEGGNTYVSSAASVYNDLLSQNPEALRTLLEPNWPIQISKRQARTTCVVRSLLEPGWPPSPCRYIFAPLLTLHDGRLMVSVDPARLGPQASHPGSDTVPNLTSEQKLALEALRATSHKNRLRIEAQPGDIIFINNWALLHSRDAYVDNGPSQTRHLVRLWLRSSKLGWSVPESMSVPWLAAYGNDPVDRLFPVEPMDVYPTLKYTAGSAAFILQDSDEE